MVVKCFSVDFSKIVPPNNREIIGPGQRRVCDVVRDERAENVLGGHIERGQIAPCAGVDRGSENLCAETCVGKFGCENLNLRRHDCHVNRYARKGLRVGADQNVMRGIDQQFWIDNVIADGCFLVDQSARRRVVHRERERHGRGGCPHAPRRFGAFRHENKIFVRRHIKCVVGLARRRVEKFDVAEHVARRASRAPSVHTSGSEVASGAIRLVFPVAA